MTICIALTQNTWQMIFVFSVISFFFGFGTSHVSCIPINIKNFVVPSYAVSLILLIISRIHKRKNKFI